MPDHCPCPAAPNLLKSVFDTTFAQHDVEPAQECFPVRNDCDTGQSIAMQRALSGCRIINTSSPRGMAVRAYDVPPSAEGTRSGCGQETDDTRTQLLSVKILYQLHGQMTWKLRRTPQPL